MIEKKIFFAEKLGENNCRFFLKLPVFAQVGS
jgi:hypothetical protein